MAGELLGRSQTIQAADATDHGCLNCGDGTRVEGNQWICYNCQLFQISLFVNKKIIAEIIAIHYIVI